MGARKDRVEGQWPHKSFLLCVVILMVGVAFLSYNKQYDSALSPTEQGNLRLKALNIVAGSKASSVQHCKVSTQYVSSELDKAWLAGIGTWQKDYCKNLAPTEQLTQEWLRANAVYDKALQQGNAVNPASALEQQHLLTTKIFSQFKTTRDCGSGDVSDEVTWIEPLAHCLRHPSSVCKRGTTVFNRTYLMPAHSSTADKFRSTSQQGCIGRTCQAIYFDLGATVLKEGPEEAGQGWFYHTYAKQGIQFDRFLLWEAVVQKPEEVYKHVPKQDLDKYQYYNLPVTTDTKDPAHPVNMLKRVAQPGDFVVFKLDIDNWQIEAALLKALLADPAALALIDEFYHEDHVNFNEMMIWWDWNKQYDPDRSLADSYQQFLKLRKAGIRAHAWV